MARRSFRRGELLLAVLKLLEGDTRSEGEVLDELEARLGAEYRLSPAAVLGALDSLEAAGLVDVRSAGGSTVYGLGGEGILALGARSGAPILAAMRKDAEPGAEPAPSHVLEHVTLLFTDIVGS